MYGKIFTSMYDGTLAATGPWEALVTFQQFIILADIEGNVDMTLEAISRRTTIPLDILTIGVAALVSPDPGSRSPNHEGRRLIQLSDTRSWGWKIVNYQHYRDIRSAEDRREYMRNYQSSRRKQLSTSVNSSKQNKPKQKQKQRQKYKKKKSAPLRASFVDNEFWEELKKNPAYQHIDLTIESGKMDAWLALPKNAKRKKTRGFVLNWINKIDRPLFTPPPLRDGAVCESRVQKGNFLKPCGEVAITMIGQRPVCQAHKEEYDARQQRVEDPAIRPTNGTGSVGVDSLRPST